MESPVVVDKPPEYHGNPINERGFPFEEEGSDAWSSLAARHPDIAARLRQRPATWASKRRPNSRDVDEDFGESFSGFDRFPFDDIPPEFREHFPSHWNRPRRFSSRDEHTEPQTSQSPPAPAQPHHHTAATQTDLPATPDDTPRTSLPQYGLRNTVDLGQKSPADPSLVDADERNQRSMSAPPDTRTTSQHPKMSGHSYPEPQAHHDQAGKVRNIPIQVEGRTDPVINSFDNVDGKNFGDAKPHAHPPQPHNIDRDTYFADDPSARFTHPPHFTKAFGSFPSYQNRTGSQPFTQGKAYPQNMGRGVSPQRSGSPKPPHDEPVGKAPHGQSAPSRPPQKGQQSPPHPPPQKGQQRPNPPPPSPPPQQPSQEASTQSSANDPITQILSIQTDVLNLMTDVENFSGSKKDKKYVFLDEMLTRNLIKLDNIETDGKENIRTARKEAIKCIQKCIAVLEAKAEKGGSAQAHDVDMGAQEKATENGEENMDAPKETNADNQSDPQVEQKQEETEPQAENKEAPQAADTRPVDVTESTEDKPDQNDSNVDIATKIGTKATKIRDKSKEKAPKNSNKDDKEKIVDKENVEAMQVDNKSPQAMEVDDTASQ